MRGLLCSKSVLVLPIVFQVAAARLLHSLPEDTYAFPKFKVAFLNHLPLLNETAERWLKEGLQGGELEFMDQPWSQDGVHFPPSRKEIGSTDSTAPPVLSHDYSLEHMKMGPRDSYLCFIPKPLDLPPPPTEAESEDDVTPAHSWSLLQPLSGTCLYHRQGWFTYSYCHNDEIRQFKELIQNQIHAPGGYKPEEDPEWESYTLGKAPPAPEPGADLTVAEQNALAANLELARGVGSRYLVQRWGDGTLCDKTKKPREVEVQFHCSMVMSDTILFVKEAKTCSYVVVINTPRLCGEPGFKSRRDETEQGSIRCREIVSSTQQDQQFQSLPEADYPQKIPRPKPVLPLPVKGAAAADKLGAGTKGMYADLLKTLQAVLRKKDIDGQQVVVQGISDDGEVVIEFLDDLPLAAGDAADGDAAALGADRILDALRGAGYDIKGEKMKKQDPKQRHKQDLAKAAGQALGNGNADNKQKKKKMGDGADEERQDDHDLDPETHVPDEQLDQVGHHDEL